MLINSDGSWFIYARQLSNQRRGCSVIDCGHTFGALVNVTLYDGPLNAQKKCTGSIVHSRDYGLASLSYKEEKWDAVARGTDPQIAEIAGRSRCGVFTRWWR